MPHFRPPFSKWKRASFLDKKCRNGVAVTFEIHIFRVEACLRAPYNAGSKHRRDCIIISGLTDSITNMSLRISLDTTNC
jgi:hypothetical protein